VSAAGHTHAGFRCQESAALPSHLPTSSARSHACPCVFTPPLAAPPAVTRTHGFLEADQQEPYGDIMLSRGEYL